MYDLTLFYHHLERIAIALRQAFSSFSGAVTALCIITLPALTTAQQTLLLLAILFVADFITGVCASYMEYKALPPVDRSRSKHTISSAGLRMSGVKFITYGIGIITAYLLESIFFIKEFEPTQITTQKLTLTTAVALFFCAIEMYSIFFENIKRMGFDLLEVIKKMAREAWAVYKDLKNENN